MTKVQCPKCGSGNAWYSRDRVDLALRCLCGYHRVVLSLLDVREEDPEDRLEVVLKLPASGSNLLKTLKALHALREANSKAVTDKLNEAGGTHKARDVASYLSVLRYKSFVTQVEIRRGMAGGSLWRINAQAIKLLEE